MLNRITGSCFALCLALGILLATSIPQAQAAPSDIIFYGSYNSNNCLVSDELFGYDSSVFIGEDSCKDNDYSCDENDEARSVKILDTVPVGTRILVYDDPECHASKDDAALLEVIESGRGDTCVQSFEGNNVVYPDSSSSGIRVRVSQFGDDTNNLDGRVSCIQIFPN